MALAENSLYAYVSLADVQTFVETSGLVDRGDWNSGAAYSINDAALYAGAYYICVAANTGIAPDGNVSDEWSVLALIRRGEPSTSPYILNGTRVIRNYHVAWGTNAGNNEINAENVPYENATYPTVDAALTALFTSTGTTGLAVETAARIAADLVVAQQGSQHSLILRDQGTNYTSSQITVEASARYSADTAETAARIYGDGTTLAAAIAYAGSLAGSFASSSAGSLYAYSLYVQGTNYTDSRFSAEVVARTAADAVVAQQGSSYAFSQFTQGTNYTNAQTLVVAQQGSQFSVILHDQGTNYTSAQFSAEAISRAAADLVVAQQGSQFSVILHDQGTNYTSAQVSAETVARAAADAVIAQQGSQFGIVLRDQGTTYTNSQFAAEAAARASADLTVAQQGSQFTVVARDFGTNYTSTQIATEAAARASADAVVAANGSQYAVIVRDQGTQAPGTSGQIPFNASGTFAASSGLAYNAASSSLAVSGTVTANTVVASRIGAPGATTEVIFNDAGTLASDAGMTFNKTTDFLALSGGLSVPYTSYLVPSIRVSTATTTGFGFNTASSGMIVGIVGGVSLFEASSSAFNVRGVLLLGSGGDCYLSRVSSGRLRVTNSSGGTVIGNLDVKKRVTAKTADYAVLFDDTNSVFTNEGASGTVIFTLPTAVAGFVCEFIARAAQKIQVKAPTSTTIEYNGVVSASAGNVESSSAARGVYIRVVALNTTEYFVTTVTGTVVVT